MSASAPGATQHLQGLVARKSIAGADPKTPAQYFGHVADVVRVNTDLTALRSYNLKRRRQVAFHGYEAVLSRTKRAAIRTTPNGGAAATLLTRLGPANGASSANAAASTTAQQGAKRSDFTVGTIVLIRHTEDLVACGARNLAGKALYGQELFSVYVEDHEAVFQVPFNALTLVRPSPAAIGQGQQQQQLVNVKAGQALIPGIIPSSAQMTNPGLLVSPTLDRIKMEHSVQLHRLMQQQYREIQVLQQRYAECRVVNPAALTSIQNELSKLRLVHLSQVQALKNKQALDLLGK
ncbi:hypothetical protein PybrP1_002241 [[Pythium] brassicae (nom. inval.)]|nr:hypothetical protein PybrP1_002241 [[Pythium] brassicae (nom. inval.)]